VRGLVTNPGITCEPKNQKNQNETQNHGDVKQNSEEAGDRFPVDVPVKGGRERGESYPQKWIKKKTKKTRSEQSKRRRGKARTFKAAACTTRERRCPTKIAQERSKRRKKAAERGELHRFSRGTAEKNPSKGQ